MQKLLIVDDDIAILKQLEFALSKEYEVLITDNSKEARALIETNEDITIAIVDLGLPPYENSHREGRIIISKLLESSDAKVIVFTGQESEEYAQELIQLGVFDYLYKPISIPTLMSALHRASFFIDNEIKDKDQISLSFTTALEDGLKGSSDAAQKQLLLKVLQKTDFNITQTSKALGISRENCYYFLKKFHIDRPL